MKLFCQQRLLGRYPCGCTKFTERTELIIIILLWICIFYNYIIDFRCENFKFSLRFVDCPRTLPGFWDQA